MMKLSTPSISRKTRLTLGVVLASASFTVLAHAGLFSIGDSDVEFRAGGPAGLKIEGKGKGLHAKEEGGMLKVTAPLQSLQTGISLRDQHLKDALKVQKHPNAVLEVKRSALKFPADGKAVQSSASGTFTLNGTKKPLNFNYKVNRTGSDFHVQGLATVDITRFNIEKPCYLGVCVDKDVKIKVKFKVRDK